MKTLRLKSMFSALTTKVCFAATLVFCFLLANAYSQTTEKVDQSQRQSKPKKKNQSPKIEETEIEEFPKFEAVINTIKKHLKTIKGYRKGDLVSREQMQGVFAKLEKLGWKVTVSKKIQKRMLPANHFLVRQLRSSKGKQFMRKMNSKSQSYSYLHRLSLMPHGSKRVRELITGPDGHKLILYFSDSKYGRKTGDMISRGKRGANFNKSTNIIYTANQFASTLKKEHGKALKKWDKKNQEKLKTKFHKKKPAKSKIV